MSAGHAGRGGAAAAERTITVSPERLARWLAGFEDRHGAVTIHSDPEVVTVAASDGAHARCSVPFPPMPPSNHLYGGMIEHAAADRRIAVLLVRRGGHAAGVFDGTELVSSKVGSRHVQGRTAAGGQSQQRFARRRDKQAREAFEAAADVAARILLPYVGTVDAVVTGGDRTAIKHVLDDDRLAAVRDRVIPPNLNVPDPKLAVLKKTPEQFRAVRIALYEPG